MSLQRVAKVTLAQIGFLRFCSSSCQTSVETVLFWACFFPWIGLTGKTIRVCSSVFWNTTAAEDQEEEDGAVLSILHLRYLSSYCQWARHHWIFYVDVKVSTTPQSPIIGHVGSFFLETHQLSFEEAPVEAVTFPEPFGLLVS